jgi:hypothetical protein
MRLVLSKMLKTSDSAGVKDAERHPVNGVVLAKITLEDEYCILLSVAKFYLFSSPASLFPNREGANTRPTWPGREVPAWVAWPVGSTGLV